MTEKLKPCPFCGSEAEVMLMNNSKSLYHVFCKNCFAMLALGSKEDVVRDWNKRFKWYNRLFAWLKEA